MLLAAMPSKLHKAFLGLLLTISAKCFAFPLIELTTELALEGSKPTLHFKLQNNGSAPLSFSRAFLPWSLGVFEAPMSARLVSFPHTEIKQIHPIADYVGDVTIEPGSSLSGVVSLSSRFIGLEKYLTKESIVVFWHWVPQPSGHEALQPIVGWFIIPAVTDTPSAAAAVTPSRPANN